MMIGLCGAELVRPDSVGASQVRERWSCGARGWLIFAVFVASPSRKQVMAKALLGPVGSCVGADPQIPLRMPVGFLPAQRPYQ